MADEIMPENPSPADLLRNLRPPQLTREQEHEHEVAMGVMQHTQGAYMAMRDRARARGDEEMARDYEARRVAVEAQARELDPRDVTAARALRDRYSAIVRELRER